MGVFFLGVLVGWAIEWAFFTFFWKPNQNESNAGDVNEVHKDCEKEHQALLTTLQDKDRDIAHLRARVANLQETADRSARQQASAEKSATSASAVPKPAGSKPEEPKKTAPKATSSKPVTQPVTRPAPRKRQAGKDDLKKVSGIGPKISELMQAEGIDNFEKLAKSNMSTLKGILEKAGTRYATADPKSWPKQAELLNAGDKAGLEKLVAELRK
jgi:predicted flap endonuclease-1-like 5' DNA nuclease